MVLVTENIYAGAGGCSGCGGGGSGQLLQTNQFVDAQNYRVTEFLYDWRNRQEFVLADADDQGRFTFARSHYDNLDRVVKAERYHDVHGDGPDPDGGIHPDDVLLARSESFHDDRGQVYMTKTYAVDPATGAVGSALAGYAWRDAAGSPIKRQPPGSKLFTKATYDSLGRVYETFTGYDTGEPLPRALGESSSSSSSSSGPSSYDCATNVDGDTILEQSRSDYDAAGSVLLSTLWRRLHNATGTGRLNDPSGSQPRGRRSYAASWYDPIGRSIASANYGTNGGSSLTRPDAVPARSDTVLVSSTEFNSAGNAYKSTDPAGKETRIEFDHAGRQTKVIRNYVDGVVSSSYPDEDVTVETAYTSDGAVLTLTAKNPTTGDQVTKYVYGTTLSESTVARSDLLRAEIYPDSDDTTSPLGNGNDGVYDRVEYCYNRQAERTQMKDQNGSVHSFEYDKLGRQVHDRVTTVGTGVDSTVRRITSAFEVRGLAEKLTSCDNATVGSGNTLNEVRFQYDDSGLLSREYQEHAGAKDGNTLYVRYNYDTTASGGLFTKGLRPTSVRYPNGRLGHFTYGTAGEMNDVLNRLAALNDDNSGNPGNSVSEYTYWGLGGIVVEDYPQPDVKLNYDSGTAGEYAGLDRFDRVTDHLWRDYGASADRDRYTYGYDRASNRLYRENTTAGAKDEFYTYDGVNQLKTFDRGDLNQEKTAISGTPAREEDFSLDMTGNWSAYVQKTSGTTDLNQSRGHNKVNEVTSASSWATPAHDRSGNMTTAPKPSSLANGLTLKYDAWNRLVEVKDGQTVVGKYEYDGLGRRIKKHIDSESPGSPNGIDRYEHFYYSSRWQVLETRDTTTESDQPENLQPKYQYVWSARYIDAPVLRDKNTDQDGLCDDERLYYLGDANYNVTCLVDTNGDAIERYLYAPYGKVTIYDGTWTNTRSVSSYSVSHLFTGRELDPETGLYHYRSRPYGAEVARFLSRDPMGYEADDVNLYRYVRGNPLLLTDPLGLDSDETGPCQINIWAGDTLWSARSLHTFLNNNTGDNAYKGNKSRICPSQYVGVVGCADFIPGPMPGFPTNPPIPGNQQIPGFPAMPGRLWGGFVIQMIKDALDKANALADQLCENRKKFCDDGKPERYECGANNQRCDSVTVNVSYDKYISQLLNDGIAPDGTSIPGLPSWESQALLKMLNNLKNHPKKKNCLAG